MIVLRRFLKGDGRYQEVEGNLRRDLLPSLKELQRGVVALSRQWKNSLYMPLLVEQNLKQAGQHHSSSGHHSSIPLRVLFGDKSSLAVSSHEDEVGSSDKLEPQGFEEIKVYSQVPVDRDLDTGSGRHEHHVREPLEPEIIITNKYGTGSSKGILKSKSCDSLNDDGVNLLNASGDEANVASHVPKKKSKPNLMHRSSKASIALLSSPFETLGTGVGKAYEFSRGLIFQQNQPHQPTSQFYTHKRSGSQGSLKSSPTSASASIDDIDYQEANLMLWMALQQDYTAARANMQPALVRRPSAPKNLGHPGDPEPGAADSRYNTLGSATSNDEKDTMNGLTFSVGTPVAGVTGTDTLPTQNADGMPPGFAFLSTGVVADVKFIFEPLFNSLGINTSFDPDSDLDDITFEQLGPRVSISGLVKLFRIDIVESETRVDPSIAVNIGSPNERSPGPLSPGFKPKNHVIMSQKISFLDVASGGTNGTFCPEVNLDTAAFICDSLTVDVDMRKGKDREKDSNKSSSKNMNKSSHGNLNHHHHPHHHAADGQHYHHQRPFASDNQQVPKSSSEDKVPIVIVGPEGSGISQVTTVVNFCVDVSNITQRVNLPLLRLLHQVASMIETVEETRAEMKANRMQFLQKELSAKRRHENLRMHQSCPRTYGPDAHNLNPDAESVEEITLTRSRAEKRMDDSFEGINVIELDNMTHVSDGRCSTGLYRNTPVGGISSSQIPKCWKTMFYLLDLYDITPETKTLVAERNVQQNQSFRQPSETKVTIEEVTPEFDTHGPSLNQTTSGANSGEASGGDCVIEMDDHNIMMHSPTTQHKLSVGQQQQQASTPGVNQQQNQPLQAPLTSTTQRKSMMMNPIVSSDQIKTYTQALIHREFTPIVIFGVVKIKNVNLVAMLSGLKLEAELSSFHVSLTHKQKMRSAAVNPRKWTESSLTGKLTQATISLLEEIPFNQQLVVKVTVGKSQTLVSSQNKKGKDSNNALLTVGPIVMDIPQHPIALHGMVTRSSRQLSTTLQELRSSRQPSRTSKHQPDVDGSGPDYVTSGAPGHHASSNLLHPPEDKTRGTGKRDSSIEPNVHSSQLQQETQDSKLIKPIVVQFSVVLESFTIGAALLPSLRAQYQIGQVTSTGTTGNKAKFVVDVRDHHLSFNTNVDMSGGSNNTNSNDENLNMSSSSNNMNLPSSANVALPPIHVSAEYLDDPQKEGRDTRGETCGSDGIVLRRGSYLNALADIGSFEHSLTTDLLNHLLLVQKVFMKEVNEVVQKMSGGDINVIPMDHADMRNKMPEDGSGGRSSSLVTTRSGRYILFSLHLRLQGIQITATTPTNNAVRLETGALELQLSNRVQNMSFKHATDPLNALNLKLFVKLQVDLNVALGQLIRNPLFEEAEPEFQSLAYFKTRIVTRNALQDELVTSGQQQQQQPITGSEEKEAVLITLKRPLIYIQPLALDKAVLVWLNYKNAYEYWNEQRANLTKEVLAATQQVLGKVHQPIQQLSSQTLGTLFLQLTVDDLGICLPIASLTGHTSTLTSMGPSSARFNYDSELKSALVITLESTRISACSCGSLVSKAKFNGLCFRFADDFETSLDDWKPEPNDPCVMNVCIVSEGTYEICSRTTTSQSLSGSRDADAKWFLNVSWKMEGFDIHVDTSIGRQLSALFSTLTALAGDEDFDTVDHSYNSEDGGLDDQESQYGISTSQANVVASTASGKAVLNRSLTVDESKFAESDTRTSKHDMEKRRTSLLKDSVMSTPGHTASDTKKRSRLIEKELNEQAKIINDLRTQGASQTKIEAEIKKLHELESAVFNDFRRDVMKKLRRQSSKSSKKVSRSHTNDGVMMRGGFSRMNTMISPDDDKQDVTFSKTLLGSIQQETRSSVGSNESDQPVSPTSTEASTVRR